MIKRLKERSENNWPAEEKFLAVVIIFLAIALGTIVRWNFISGSNYPVNDGGLFYSLITDLIENNFNLPIFTTYNVAEIPNSYPPLAFYLIGVLNAITKIPILSLVHYFPFVINVLTIPVFFRATNLFLPEDLFSRALATYLFATLPRSYEWFVMGGGITRSLGFLFSITALIFYAKAVIKEKPGIDLILAGLFSCLTVLSHPVAGIFLAFSIFILTIYYWPVKWVYPIFIGLFVVAASSPWWTLVIKNHGVSPFIGAVNTGHVGWLDAGYLLTLNFGFENRFFLPLVSLLAILGLFSSQRRESKFLGVLIGVGYLFVPRGGVDLLTIYLALLAALGFSMIIKFWSPLDVSRAGMFNVSDKLDRRGKILLIGLIIYTFIGSYAYKYIDGKADLHLTDADQQAMLWVQDNTEKEAKVMHLPPTSNSQDWWNDYFGEWMPVFTGRHSVATVQGYEWLPGEFSQRIDRYISLRSCTERGVPCIENWVITYDYEFDYLLLCKRQHAELLIENILEYPIYSVVYENEDVIVIERLEDNS